MLNLCISKITSSFIFCYSSQSELFSRGVPREEASPLRPDSLFYSNWLTMRFSWPRVCRVLRMFGGVTMSTSSVLSSLQRQYTQQPAPVGRQTEMRFNLQALTFNPLKFWESCQLADALYIRTHKYTSEGAITFKSYLYKTIYQGFNSLSQSILTLPGEGMATVLALHD